MRLKSAKDNDVLFKPKFVDALKPTEDEGDNEVV